ncbi:restriction endonuclease subunit S [Methylomonas sp. SURF-2]|uniref:Restriction endonuclease subunit S n=1 Tax=Methylomonas subterranea TaxID=2952225 RepID=A0ABT1TCP6_9GAMM|nr:restriction endonuclease subunit S [Methylomonas sp. SURF-2]MCQ8103220.1 restriction endonuclease subunit S [Methylomonas sp. SURF-2]
MIEQLAALPTYETYKDSGVEWLGEIPAHWKVVPLKYSLSLNSEKISSRNSTLKYYGMENIESWSGRFIETESEVEGLANKFSENDILFGKLRPYLAKVALATCEGICSTEFLVYRAKKQSANFFKYLLLSTDFINLVDASTYGSKMPRANADFIGIQRLPIPNLPEQTAIAAFLDRKTAQIDQAVAIKEQQIALLKERKQILIQNAVTRGLDPSIPMRDSGVEWIGEVPAHWELLANRALFRERIEQGEEGLPLLSVSIHTAVSSEEISDEENIRGRIKIEDKTKYNLVQPGDIVFNMMRAWQGAIGAVAVKGMVSPAYIIATPSPKIASSYFEYQYRCPEFIQQMDRNSKGITDFRKRLYWNEFKQLMSVVPPIEEQTTIVTHIETQSAKIDQAIAIQQQQIDKLKEYKATLINSAVTGKIKVPELVESQDTA